MLPLNALVMADSSRRNIGALIAGSTNFSGLRGMALLSRSLASLASRQVEVWRLRLSAIPYRNTGILEAQTKSNTRGREGLNS